MTRIQRGWAVAAVLAGALFACTIALFLGADEISKWKLVNSIIVFQQILPDRHRMALFAVKRPVYELLPAAPSGQGKTAAPWLPAKGCGTALFYQSRTDSNYRKMDIHGCSHSR